MCDPEKDNRPKSKVEQQLMDLDDLDLYNSWTLDHLPFISSSVSPFLVSSTEQPSSPLWTFSDTLSAATAPAGALTDDDKLSSAAVAAPFRLADYPLIVACTPSSVAETTTESADARRFPSPFSGLIPVDYSDGHCLIKEKMSQALRYFKESTEQHVLAQVWAPVRKWDRYVLTTSGQPFVLDPRSSGLNQYRMVSAMYVFSVDGETEGELGLPGRVFRQKLPEWTPDVQYYSSREFSRLDHALHYNVRGTLALPVFEPSLHSCVGVVELIMTSQKINYASEVDRVCKALKAVNLESSEILDHQSTQICNESRQNALAEILEILTVVCETHKLPLAQTWVPCRHRSVLANGGGVKKSCMSFDGSCMGQVCMSTTDAAFYVVDAPIWGFREACVEHHLQKGQGVAGRAFLSQNASFCRDITQFGKNEYPLVHYARMFNLTGCFAICLQSSQTGEDDYILEFFLPPAITDKNEQDTLLGSLLGTMKEHFQSFNLASGSELGEEEGSIEFIQASSDGKVYSKFEPIRIHHSIKSPPRAVTLLRSRELILDSIPIDDKRNVVNVGKSCPLPSLPELKETRKTSERKRGKTEKTIRLDVLQQYFSGSLKDAAKSLGVCPTTMKRICRQHGISRWPSRKINKVNRSLSKLKRVIESVQGGDGAIDITSLTSSPLPVAVGSISWPSNLNHGNQLNSPSSENHGQKHISPHSRSPGSDAQAQNHIPHEQNGSPEVSRDRDGLRTGSGSREESAGTPTSHGSCDGSPTNELVKDAHVTFNIPSNGTSPPVPVATFSVPTSRTTTAMQEPFRGMLVEDAGSCKDLSNLCPSVTDAVIDERFAELSWMHPMFNSTPQIESLANTAPVPCVTANQVFRSITIKATYQEDIIRFRISPSSGIMDMKDEVAKRLKLEVGTFEIKYLDEDHELVLIACDTDLHECLDVTRSSGSNIVRLSIHDITANLGSSCESTGELS